MQKILITEDDAIGRRVLELFLEPYGPVEKAEDGDEALRLFDAAHRAGKPFNLIFLDLGIPGKNGLDVLKGIREFESANSISVPALVFILTGNTDQSQIDSVFRLGASRFLLKPVLESELLTQLKELGLIPSEE